MPDYKCKKFLAATIEVAKAQVIRDVVEGTVPEFVESFRQLHDTRDANYYGDAFNYDFSSSDEHCNFWNAVQNAVHEWIVKGGISVRLGSL